ncbi:hypothetical protein FNX44_022905, partial [Streptomyces sp. OF1]|nr:hypothetical protein [Streptomyces alkaliterrae]
AGPAAETAAASRGGRAPGGAPRRAAAAPGPRRWRRPGVGRAAAPRSAASVPAPVSPGALRAVLPLTERYLAGRRGVNLRLTRPGP